jgi:hypothetical protein
MAAGALALKRHKGAVQPPRFVWDVDTAGKKNWHRDSEDLEAWTSTTNMTVSNAAATITLANGQEVELALLTGDATVAVHSIIQNAHFGDGSPDPSLFAVTRRNSLYVKAGTARYVVVSSRLINGAGGTQYQSIFDFQTEAWVYEGTFYTNHGFESLGGGAYRLWFNDPVNSTAYGESTIAVTSGDTVFDSIYDATGETVYAGGWQIEFVEGDPADGPTYYAKTQGKTADRTDPTIIRQRVRSTTAWSPSDPITNLLYYGDFSAGWGSETNNTFTATNHYVPGVVGGQLAFANTDNNDAGGGSELYALKTLIGELDSPTYGRLLSVYAKASTHDQLLMRIVAVGADANADAYFDLTAGTVGTVAGESGVAAAIQEVPGAAGWYRCILQSGTTTSDTNWQVRFTMAEADNDRTVNVRDGKEIFLANPMLEDAAGTTPSQYVPTDSASSETATYDNNVIYMFKGAVQSTKLALERRVQLVRSRTAFLLRGLTRNLIN